MMRIMEDGVEEMWIMRDGGKQKSVFREVGTRHICLNRANTNENSQRVGGHNRNLTGEVIQNRLTTITWYFKSHTNVGEVIHKCDLFPPSKTCFINVR